MCETIIFLASELTMPVNMSTGREKREGEPVRFPGKNAARKAQPLHDIADNHDEEYGCCGLDGRRLFPVPALWYTVYRMNSIFIKGGFGETDPSLLRKNRIRKPPYADKRGSSQDGDSVWKTGGIRYHIRLTNSLIKGYYYNISHNFSYRGSG